MNNKLIFFIIFILGFFLRWHNISPFKIYPDSYQNLLVAENISMYQSVLGYLGPQGIIYPDFFMWTRPGYAILINILNFFTNNMTLSAELIAFTAGALAIPLSYFFINIVFKSKTSALAGAALLALSFNHTVWSGFIMTETTGVLLQLFFLWIFFKYLKTKPAFVPDFIIGILFACAVMTRYEYTILLLPIIFLIFQQSRQPIIRTITITSTFLITLGSLILVLFPIESITSVIGNQLQDILLLVTLLVMFFLTIFYVLKLVSKKNQKSLITIFHKILPGFILFSILFLFFFIGAVREFITNDVLISILSLVGISLMLQKKDYQDIVLFVFLAVFALGVCYFHTNPDMERYMTHLIPFLLLPASYGVMQIIKQKKIMVLAGLVIITSFQIIITYYGLKFSQDSEWFRISYEEKAAGIIKQSLSNRQNELLLVSLPEPYYYNLKASIYSVKDTYPFITIDDSLNQNTILVVSDMPMHEIFPTFSDFIEKKLKKYKMTQFWVKENYLYINKTYEETYPVIIYKLSLKELKTEIKKSRPIYF